MVSLFTACLLTGCLDVPIIVSNDPVSSYIQNVTKRRKQIDKSEYSCYINGEFFTSCPTK